MFASVLSSDIVSH